MWERELEAMIAAGKAAAVRIMEIYQAGFEIEIKEDHSPVTLADKTADRMISEYLKHEFPAYAMLTEESSDDKSRLQNDYCFIVDPVDGTKDFCAKNGEFATNIALCYCHRIVVGVVVLPSTGSVYYAVEGQGAYRMDPDGTRTRIHVSDRTDGLTMYTSRFHSSEEEKRIPQLDHRIQRVEAHGSSIKACYIAEGRGEVHYRTNEGTKEWDTAPIDLIVREAGGVFAKPDGTLYGYNREDVYNHEGYIIANRKENIFRKE